MLRDISKAVRIKGEPVLMAALVLDPGTGLALGCSVASNGPGALAQSLGAALTKPVGASAPVRPDLILCAEGLASDIEAALATLCPGEGAPPIRQGQAAPEAEAIFDSLIAHLSGRSQPDEPPTPEDWRLGVEVALRYCQQAPWERWNHDVSLRLELGPPDYSATYIAVVLGGEGMKRGLILYPGAALPSRLDDWWPGQALPVPSGTLILIFDSPAEVPGELVAKAVSYGWAADAEVVPAFIKKGPNGPLEMSRHDLHHLTLGAVAVVAHDRRGPIVVGAGSDTTGELILGDGQRAGFSLAVSTGGGDGGRRRRGAGRPGRR